MKATLGWLKFIGWIMGIWATVFSGMRLMLPTMLKTGMSDNLALFLRTVIRSGDWIWAIPCILFAAITLALYMELLREDA